MAGQGFTQAQALKRLRQLTNETTYPDDFSAIGYLNDGLDQVNDELDPVKQLVSININNPNNNQAFTCTLPSVIQDIEMMTYSSNLPTLPGTTEDEMTELGTAEYLDATGSFPATGGGGSTVFWRRLADTGGSISIQLYPAPSVGFLNVYYYERATSWDPSNPNALTTVDQAYQYLAIYWAAARICETRENLRGKASYFTSLYDAMMAKKMTIVRRRERQRGSSVRDVTSDAGGIQPSWFSGG